MGAPTEVLVDFDLDVQILLAFPFAGHAEPLLQRPFQCDHHRLEIADALPGVNDGRGGGLVPGSAYQKVGPHRRHLLFDSVEVFGPGFDPGARMLYVLHAGLRGFVENRPPRSDLHGIYITGAEPGEVEDGGPHRMEDVVLIRLALPVLQVEVGQPFHRRIGFVEILALSIGHYERDSAQ